MDGIIANLAGVRDLADKYDAMVMVDDSHAVGFVGTRGRGSPEHCGVEGRIDIVTGTLGKALGGALRRLSPSRQGDRGRLAQAALASLSVLQRANAGRSPRPSLKLFELIEEGDALRQRLYANAARFRDDMTRPASRWPAPAIRSSR